MVDFVFTICAIIVDELVSGTGAYMCMAYGPWVTRRYKRKLYVTIVNLDLTICHCIWGWYNYKYGSETWRLTENNKRRVEATEMDALRRTSRISRKGKIRNVTIRQQIGLEETIIKEIEQNQLTSYGHVQRMAEGRLPKIALKWMPK